MWIPLLLLTLCFSTSQTEAQACASIPSKCETEQSWTRCYEEAIAQCSLPRFSNLNIKRNWVNSLQKAEVNVTTKYTVQIPPSALHKSRWNESEKEVLLVVSVISSTFFKQQTPRPRKGRGVFPLQPVLLQGEVLGQEVLFVRAGSRPVKNLTHLITLRFRHKEIKTNSKALSVTCVFWNDSVPLNEPGRWSTYGCSTRRNGEEIICSCNHLSFFAVLVNPNTEVDENHKDNLSYITYVGSGLSVLFAFISLFIYVGRHRRRPEKANGVHIQLTVALFCLHLGFLACSFWVQLPNGMDNSWVCYGLGLFLHWSLVATFTWVALEGFHLYLLLVRVFNIYVRRYLLKLGIVGWGLPSLVAIICGISGAYGKYSLKLRNSNITTQICWLSSEFQYRHLVSYITVSFLCLVVLYNSCMLALVVFKLWRIRGGREGYECSSNWKKMTKEKWTRLWKDCATVLGLSCVLGLPWGLASVTYITLAGIYVFTIFNSLQGFFMFLWSVALSCKSQKEQNSSSDRDSSTQKMMTTSC
ncbi:adhesion G protein-coupled receptor G3 [Nematolebias whitei]|uniref:adhesion G protein-coupled receptor G3 n=1 Tax=Nematolebias whitei TaxID=451745 RepID=UPI0018997760|nr:adhesion G protein-coupled receptor G3 [Nematolebias whitei]